MDVMGKLVELLAEFYGCDPIMSNCRKVTNEIGCYASQEVE